MLLKGAGPALGAEFSGRLPEEQPWSWWETLHRELRMWINKYVNKEMPLQAHARGELENQVLVKEVKSIRF